jgi:patatin-related protein
MREKELRLALICYGGISLAVYMHGITKEIWHLLRASRAFYENKNPDGASEAHYAALLKSMEQENGLRLQVLADIIAGASAGGINGIFLSQAIATGQSLTPLTRLWLECADVEQLLDPDARPLGRFTKFWAQPLAWLATRKPGGTIDRTVATEARDEVRTKLSQFVRARWFEPPFGGRVFSNLLFDAFDAMAKSGNGVSLLPPDQPLDLFVTVTDFKGHPERLRLHSPREIIEKEHRLTLSFRHWERTGSRLGDAAGLVYAARATASFPGAFPPFTVKEVDHVIADRGQSWPGRDMFLNRILPRTPDQAEKLILIDGSVLANAPFRPAIDALRDRPARREVDRRFVYIDPKPGIRSVSLTRKGEDALPGFFSTILGAMSDIPREQPIRDSLDAIEGRSSRIRRMQRIIEAIEPEVEASIQSLFGMTFFLNSPTLARLEGWRRKAQDRAAIEAAHSYAAYATIKLSSIVEDIVSLTARANPAAAASQIDHIRQLLWIEVRRLGSDAVVGPKHRGSSAAALTFFRDFDIQFRIRRLRFVARTLTTLVDTGQANEAEIEPLRQTIFKLLAPFLERENSGWFGALSIDNPAQLLSQVRDGWGLIALDEATDAAMAAALTECAKAERRQTLLAYVGFPYFDMSTLPLLQGEGLDEFNPIKVDRIAPDDAPSIRAGGASATLKGIEFNSFGAFFSKAYRENDYLWGRLHGAERLIDIVLSTLPGFPDDTRAKAIKRAVFDAILTEEQSKLTTIPDQLAKIREEIAHGPLAESDSAA